jgi:hypothetical protein
MIADLGAQIVSIGQISMSWRREFDEGIAA